MNLFFRFIIYAVISIFVFTYNRVLGALVAVALILHILINNRSGYFEMIANMSYRRGNVDKALIWLKRAYQVKKSSAKTKILYSYLLLKTGNLDESESILKTLLDSKNLTLDQKMLVKSNYALVLWKKGMLDEALKELEEVYEKYKTTTLYGSFGYLLILKGDLDRALEINKEAYEYNSSDHVIIDNLAYTHYLLGNIRKSDELYEKLMSMNPSFPEAYYNYSIVLVTKQEYSKALQTAKKALNYRLSFLSSLTKEELDHQIKEIEDVISRG